jgi:phospholipid/cholesterol/gamma-HCH transport system substrate-binding protein
LAPISASTYATLGYQGVTGLAFIQLDDIAPLDGATAPQAPLSENSRIPLKPGLMSQLSDQGERILGQLDQASQRLNELLSSQNQQTLMTTVDHLGKAALEIERFSAQTRTLLPEMAKGARDSLATLKVTSLQVGESADAARTSAQAFQRVTERMDAPGGTLDQLGQATEVWVATNQTLQGITLPHLNSAAQDLARSTRQIGELAQILRDAPQAMLLGAPTPAPGPGEPGFPRHEYRKHGSPRYARDDGSRFRLSLRTKCGNPCPLICILERHEKICCANDSGLMAGVGAVADRLRLAAVGRNLQGVRLWPRAAASPGG